MSNNLTKTFFLALLKIVNAKFGLLEEFSHNTQSSNSSIKVWHTFLEKFCYKMIVQRKTNTHVETIPIILQTKLIHSKQFKKQAKNSALENCGGPSFTCDYVWCLKIMIDCVNRDVFSTYMYNHDIFDISKINISEILKRTLKPVSRKREKDCHSFLQWASLDDLSVPYAEGKWMIECLRLKRPLQKPTGWFVCNRSHIDASHLSFAQDSNFDSHKRMNWKLTSPHIDAIFMILVKLLSFPSLEIQHCYQGFFKILDSTTDHRQFMFCGVHSTFHVFIPFFKATVQIDFLDELHFFVKAHASLTDRRIISQAVPVKKSHPSFRLVFSIQSTRLLLYLQTYHIIVQKICTIKIYLSSNNETQYRIQDGPSYFSSSVVPHGHIAKCSSFQCHLAMLSTNLFISKTLGSLNFSSERVAWRKIAIKSSGKEFLFCGVQNTDQTFAVNMQAGPGFHLNVTIIQMTFKGIQGIRCLHGGLTIYEHHDSIQQEIVTFCSQISSRNIYSNGSQLYFLVYQYKDYQNILLQIKTSLTECKHVTVDPSLVSKNCYFALVYGRRTDIRCILFLANISSLFIAFSMSQSSFHYDNNINYFVMNTNCFVLQIRTSSQRIFDDTYDILLTHNMMKYERGVTVVQTLNAQLENYKDSMYVGECLKILAKVNELEAHFKGRTTVYKTSDPKKISKPVHFYVKEVSSNREKRQETITMAFKVFPSFLAAGLVALEFYSPFPSLSWIETTIFISKEPANTTQITALFSGIEIIDTFLDFHFFFDHVLTKMTKFDSVLFQIPDYIANKSVQTLEIHATAKENSKIQMVVDLRLQLFPSGYELCLQSTNFLYTILCPCSERHFLMLDYDNSSYNVTSQDNNISPCRTSCADVLVYHVRNTYKEYSHFYNCYFSKQFPPIFTPISFSKKSSSQVCSSLSKYASYYLVKHSAMISWNESDRLCQRAQTFLPSFHSQLELDELMALIKLSSSFPVLEALYIGLTFTTSTQVKRIHQRTPQLI